MSCEDRFLSRTPFEWWRIRRRWVWVRVPRFRFSYKLESTPNPQYDTMAAEQKTEQMSGKKRKADGPPSAVPAALRSTKRDIPPSPSLTAKPPTGSMPAYISLTTHAGRSGVKPVAINWGASTPEERGPIIATNRDGGVRNCIGAHGGSYSVYRALAVAAKALDPGYRPQLKMTAPAMTIGPYPSWKDPTKIVTMDPWGHEVTGVFNEYFEKGYDIRPTIAVTKAHIDIPELKGRMRTGHLKPDGKVRAPPCTRPFRPPTKCHVCTFL